MLNEQIARGVGPSRIDIAYERRGDPSHPTALLVMGLAAQMVNWPVGFLDALVRRGLHVVRFDNRDAGHSTHLHDAPPPDLPAALRGDLSSASYTLSHMAADAVAVTPRGTSRMMSTQSFTQALQMLIRTSPTSAGTSASARLQP